MNNVVVRLIGCVVAGVLTFVVLKYLVLRVEMGENFVCGVAATAAAYAVWARVAAWELKRLVGKAR